MGRVLGLSGLVAMRPGVAIAFWNRLAAFALLGILVEYFGEALLVGG